MINCKQHSSMVLVRQYAAAVLHHTVSVQKAAYIQKGCSRIAADKFQHADVQRKSRKA